MRIALFMALAALACAAERRLVIVKLDGVPAGLWEDTLRERDPRTGKSKLPWVDEIFARHGARLENFYVRGISLSAPSWAMLDTGQHQRIHGNVEYDRLTLKPYDYLNFFPFYLSNAAGRREDMPGAEVLDAAGVPLLIDSFPKEQRYQSFQLFQRGVRWKTLRRSLSNRFTSRSPRELFDEWQTGFEFSNSVNEQSERELLGHLADSRYLYLDFFSGDFDHIAHLTNSRPAQVTELQQLDGLIGRIWTAIRNGPLAADTILVVVSDHGMNSTEGVYSQGYSLVDWLRSAAGGAHHTATDRYPLTEYKVRGLNPLVSEVISPSSASEYLKNDREQYPTAYLDVDGNERAALQLRNSSLNTLHILLKQIVRQHLTAPARAAATAMFFDVLDAHRAQWAQTVTELKEGGSDAYAGYINVMSRLLSLRRGPFDWEHLRPDDLIPKRSLGERNTVFDLQNYAVGPAPDGLVRRMNYFQALRAIQVRNNPQTGVANRPIDFIAARIPQGIWLYSDEDHQAVIEGRQNAAGELELHYRPVAHLRGASDGSVSWTGASWTSDLPLRIWEDQRLCVPTGVDRDAWLNQWHTDREWLEATHRTRYSNGVIGIHEQFVQPEPEFGRFEARRQQLIEPDLILFANGHWNFNVRGFNPGGNHGSFFRISTHSVLLFAGGEQTGIPRGLVIDRPYDSLSLMPTLLELLGKDPSRLPGPSIREILPAR